MDTSGYVKKQTLYLAVMSAIILGFIAGVVYSIYRTPSITGDAGQAAHQHEIADTIAALEQTTQDKPDNGQAWIELGHAYFDTGQTQKAITAYTKALSLIPGDLNVMTDLAVMYHENKQHQKAIELFDQVLQINPQHEQARFNKGVVLFTGLHDQQAALNEWKTLLKYHPMAAAPSGKLVGELVDQLEKEKSTP
ncbi:MAG: tetratricopeptide repeat protein [Desulfobulbus sp.]|nr:tetratricopeptide repeat protein [Desulfobulbus sp.]